MNEIPAPRSWKQFFVKGGRLRGGWRLLLYISILVIMYFGITLLFKIMGTYLGQYGLVLRAVAVLLGTWVCRRFIDKRDMASLGFRIHRKWPQEIGLGLLLGFGMMGSIFLVEVVCGWIRVEQFGWEVQTTGSFVLYLVRDVVILIGVAVWEETLFRGYLLQTIEESLGTPTGIIVSSVLFGLIHMLNSAAGEWDIYVIPFTLTLAGLVLATAYFVRRSMWLPLALHFSWNFFQYDVFSLTGSSANSPTFLMTTVKGPQLWVGSAFGPEVGILGILAMLIVIGILLYLQQKNKSGVPGKNAA